MQQAMQAVKEGRMSVNRAALKHGVPKSTLKDRISGRVKHGSRWKPPVYLSEDKEEELAAKRCDREIKAREREEKNTDKLQRNGTTPS